MMPVTSSGLDAYAVVTAAVPEPPPEPDPREAARENRHALFRQEQHGDTWTAPLDPARPGRQRTPAPPEASGPPGDTAGTERGAMCILGPGGGHLSRGLHCPHDLPEPGGEDTITTVWFWS